MQWNTSYVNSVYSFANNINTHEGGTHLQGFRAALTRTLNRYAREKGLLKEKEDNLEGEDVREGLAAVISVKLASPQFEGGRGQAGQPPIAGLVEQVVNQARRVPRGEPAGRAPDHHQGGLGRARQQAARKARELTRRKSALNSSLPGKLADCSIKDPSPSSSSSRATPRAARPRWAADRTYQAILPCAGRSSTARRTGSTRSSPTTRSRR